MHNASAAINCEVPLFPRVSFSTKLVLVSPGIRITGELMREPSTRKIDWRNKLLTCRRNKDSQSAILYAGSKYLRLEGEEVEIKPCSAIWHMIEKKSTQFPEFVPNKYPNWASSIQKVRWSYFKKLVGHGCIRKEIWAYLLTGSKLLSILRWASTTPLPGFALRLVKAFQKLAVSLLNLTDSFTNCYLLD
jgi:hypothetical protein